MVPPSQALGSTDAEGEGREDCEAEDQVKDVRHAGSPKMHSRKMGPIAVRAPYELLPKGVRGA